MPDSGVPHPGYPRLMTDSSPGALAGVGERDHVIGAASPRLTLIEYGDFGCPFCVAANRPVMSLLDRFDGLRLVWRHLPDPELHPGSDLAAELSELAASHGKFWEAHALLLAGRETFSRQDLLAAAEQLGVAREEAEDALGERRFREHVLADIEDGRRAGAHGTPTFFVDGERLEGPWRELAQVVPARLRGTSDSDRMNRSSPLRVPESPALVALAARKGRRARRRAHRGRRAMSSSRSGDDHYPFIAILEGEVAMLDGAGNEIVRQGRSNFLGELSLLSGQSAFLTAVVTRALALHRGRQGCAPGSAVRRRAAQRSAARDVHRATGGAAAGRRAWT